MLVNWIRYFPIHRWFSRFCCSGRLLDVGCGRGKLVEYLQNRKWEAYGIDPVLPFNFKGKPFFKCSIENAPFLENSFDVIIFNFSLEHIDNPEAALEHAHKLLTLGGLIFIRAPNYGNISGRKFWDSFQMRIPSHRNFFNLHNLKSLLEKHRFAIFQISTPLSINAAITIPCSLFPQLDPIQWIYGESKLLWVIKAIFLSVLSIIFLPITWIQCRLGQGAVIHAVAEKT